MIGLAIFVCAVVGALRLATLTTRATKRAYSAIGAALKSARKRFARALKRKPRTPKLDDKQLLAMALQLAHEALRQRGQAVPSVVAWRETSNVKAMVRS